jgi:hypothetical protein
MGFGGLKATDGIEVVGEGLSGTLVRGTFKALKGEVQRQVSPACSA